MKNILILLIFIISAIVVNGQSLESIAHKTIYKKFQGRKQIIKTDYGEITIKVWSYHGYNYKMLVTIPNFSETKNHIEEKKDYQFKRVGTIYTDYYFQVPYETIYNNYIEYGCKNDLIESYLAVSKYTEMYVPIVEYHKFIGVDKVRYALVRKNYLHNHRFMQKTKYEILTKRELNSQDTLK